MKEVPISPRKQPFQAPKGYFADFDERLKRRLEDEKNEKNERIPKEKNRSKSPWPYLSTGVAASLLVGLFWLLQVQNAGIRQRQDALEAGLFSNISDEEIIDYLSDTDLFTSDLTLDDADLDEFTLEEYEALYDQ